MADVKISGLPAASSVTGDDLFEITNDPGGTPASQKATGTQLLNFVSGNIGTTYTRTLLDDTDAATARATLGLVVGTDVQAYDAELAALAGVTSAANAVPVFTGSGTADVVALGASQLLGRGSTGIIAPITLGSNLSMSGTTLSASGGGSVSLYAQANGGTSANNTATETTIWSFTLTGGDLNSNGILRGFIRVHHDGLVGQGMKLRLKLGSTTLCDTIVENSGSTDSNREQDIWFELKGNNSTSAQHGWIKSQSVRAASGGEVDTLSEYGTASEDTTGNLTVTVTAVLSTASTSLGWDRLYAWAQIINA